MTAQDALFYLAALVLVAAGVGVMVFLNKRGKGMQGAFDAGQPHGPRRIFEVSVAHLARLKTSAQGWLLAIACLLPVDAYAVLGPPAIRSKDASAKVCFILVTLALVPFAVNSWRRYLAFKSDPLAMVAYDTGVWLRIQDIFVPYDRIAAVEVDSSEGFRLVYLRIAAQEKRLSLPAQDGVFNLPHADIARKIHELAALAAAAARTEPPKLAIEPLPPVPPA